MFTYVKSLLLENRFVYQEMLHPYYSQLTKDIRGNMLGNISMQITTKTAVFPSGEAAKAIALLFNSALNNYILTQDEESFRVQIAFLLKLMKQ